MKKVLFVVVILLNISFTVSAQSQGAAEDIILQSLVSNPVSGPSLPEGNQAIINQYGQDNSGLINQFQAQYGTGGNYGNIYQEGNINTAILYQYGNQISTDISQIGNENYAQIVLDGQNINGNISQNGNSNIIDQNLRGNDINYSLLQEGSNNQFIQYQEGLNSTNFEVSQVGDGITTVLINGAAVNGAIYVK